MVRILLFVLFVGFFVVGVDLFGFISGCFQINEVFAQVNNIKSRAKDNQNDRTINKSYSAPSNNNSGGSNSSSPPPARYIEPAPSKNNSTQPQRTSNQYSTSKSTNSNANEADNESQESVSGNLDGCNDMFNCCSGYTIGVESSLNSFIKHQEFLVQSKVVNPRIVSFEVFAIGAIPFLYSNDSVGNQYFPRSILSIPKIRATWGMLSTELRVSNLYQFGVGHYETTDWQILMINFFSKREFYLRVGSGFMFEKLSNTFYFEHSLSSDILLSTRLSGTFDFRFSHDTETAIFPRLESGIRINYTFLESKYADLSYNFGFLYQNYYQTERLYLVQTGIGLLLH
ncbi:MAG: hypothetical protein ACKVOU_08695 [Cytophagales bacterium]